MLFIWEGQDLNASESALGRIAARPWGPGRAQMVSNRELQAETMADPWQGFKSTRFVRAYLYRLAAWAVRMEWSTYATEAWTLAGHR